MDIFRELFFVLWFFLPAGLANIGAFLSAKIPVLHDLSYPLDFNRKLHGKRILGDHKTIRGVLSGAVVGILIVWIQILWYAHSSWVRNMVPLDYSLINPILLGTLAGLGALLGDAAKSFFKRQRYISPGKSWVPFDQIDYIVGGVVFMSLYIRLSFVQYVLLFIVWFLLHPIFNLLGYCLGLKKEKF